MPSILSDEDKQTVKRTVPKSANKIHAVAVAKLYIAYPDRHRWTYTGLQGAAVLANDLVGNTFWLKMVDISRGARRKTDDMQAANRGVIWDQEIYDTFSYNQDRVFFHTFELEDCLAALSFADEKEAKTFKKKLDDREKNAHKNTKNKPFGAAAGTSRGPATNGKSSGHGLLGGLFGHRNSSASAQPPAHSIIPPSSNITSPSQSTFSPAPSSRSSAIDTTDPSWQPLLKELLAMGITEDQIEENADFIKLYIEQRKTEESLKAEQNEKRSRAPPPPPPSAPHDCFQTRAAACTAASPTDKDRGAWHQPQFVCKPSTAISTPRAVAASWTAKTSLQSTSAHCRSWQVCKSATSTTEQIASFFKRHKSRTSTSPTTAKDTRKRRREASRVKIRSSTAASKSRTRPPSSTSARHTFSTSAITTKNVGSAQPSASASASTSSSSRARRTSSFATLVFSPHPAASIRWSSSSTTPTTDVRDPSAAPNAEQISTAPTTNARERSPSASANAKQWCTTSSAPNAPGLWTSSTSPNAAERCRPTPAPRRRSSPTEAGGWTRRLACGYPWSQAAVPGSEPPAGAAGGSGPATPGGEAGLAGALASALAARKAKVSHSDDESDKDDW
ncbi:hypothetical protein SNOG_07847 [Parastagonospora nodorum SN15]|uniref:WH1 domain-containing protein n=1 Tax=Phaeosphaeria nodorum (strain SN15 / ATCC MYA-4574 / FGSC 10173) TaxID=321614 RepID=Q0UK67_PHANO|nr:hypothetical protein SNOG_07847 [Parastagonospora nodorum SN15]EAT85313.2 hypothetical protein SNOG_07847 [Parastagonospora nodorum SN15]